MASKKFGEIDYGTFLKTLIFTCVHFGKTTKGNARFIVKESLKYVSRKAATR